MVQEPVKVSHRHQDVIDFWFKESQPSDWYKKSDAYDALIRERFLACYHAVVRGECAHWRDTPEGRLAEVIVLDQFSRNMFRGDPKAFLYDPLALALSQEAIRAGVDQKLEPRWRSFLYMPFMHSESLLIHEQAVELFSQPGLEYNLEYEHKHKAIIERFGRYPHRNAVLKRASTAEEVEFLKQPGSSF